jgi:hypothetical protein
LPPALLAPERAGEFYGEWLDSYFARDVEELFRVEKRAGFLRVLELLLRQSGGMLTGGFKVEFVTPRELRLALSAP